jgi:chromatin remodeling complex protein RSC6
MWEYIKGNDLQNPANKKEILMDKKMKELFVGVDKLDMFSMNKHLSKHIYKKE